MKRIYIPGLTLVIGLICWFCLGSHDAQQVREERPVVSSMTVTPEVPSTVHFCEKEYDLTRYDRHEGIDRELSSFTYFHSTTLLLFKRANRYFPVIEPILKAQGVPDDFKYLAVIESHLDPRVSSPARAVGMWQFLETTGKQYGLTITTTVDERCHVEKATVAACKYLKDAYAKYGDWATVASSYNAGMGRITGELQKQFVDHSMDLWVVEETTRYAYRIMAIKLIFENPYRYGFVLRAQDLYKPIECEEVAVTADILDLADWAKKRGVTYADLKRFNPWLRDRKLQTGGRKYTLQVPKQEEMYYHTPNTIVHNPKWVVR
ncbi:membrane-bound lytic murein transglycosylase D [Parabacteroides sp. PFB2-12]|uniref:lytic transglycosylase domain-containing protein n=1 Tax=Parabacteroides sp. PFB2-12 TaxID=2940652 RepID=UPI0024753320|nr:lytic transglycosylase domain-containing protein [Parabacteroides sp. PFB2-12]MDH6389660.1 membrane-bound lytic murein transglycosylase D [Parabacteroides sp. PFB2-12]